MPRRHDHDAGGDAEVLEAKAAIREDTWSRLSVDGVARFPRPDGRIPNFVGAEAAAERLRSTDAWQAARTVKGGGFSDLEYALASAAGLIGVDTVVATTVHELQVRDRGEIPVSDHDFPLDLIVTPDRVIECRPARRRQPGIDWDLLTPKKIASIPLLAAMAEDR